jgi:hypothetical protein
MPAIALRSQIDSRPGATGGGIGLGEISTGGQSRLGTYRALRNLRASQAVMDLAMLARRARLRLLALGGGQGRKNSGMSATRGENKILGR